MSANVFTAIGPIAQGSKIGGAALCGTEKFPIGLTGTELMEWYWMTRYVNSTNLSTVSAGPENGSFSGGVVNGPETAADDRNSLVLIGRWTSVILPTTALGDSTFVLFEPTDSAPNDYPLAYDGTLWYPYIKVAGSLAVFDGGSGDFASLQWDSWITSNPLGTPGTASILGKSIPLSYSTSTSGSGAATFASPTLVRDSDWPYV